MTSVSDVDVGKNITEERSSWCGSVEAEILPRNFDHLPQNRHRRGRRKQVSWRDQLEFCLDGGIGTENMKADMGHAFRLQRSYSLSESASDGKPSCLCYHANQLRRSVRTESSDSEKRQRRGREYHGREKLVVCLG